MNTNNKFDNIIKESLGSHEEAPPAYMWDKISSGINAPIKIAFYKTAYFKIAVVAASLTILIGLSLLFTNTKTQKIISKTPNTVKADIKNSPAISKVISKNNIQTYSKNNNIITKKENHSTKQAKTVLSSLSDNSNLENNLTKNNKTKDAAKLIKTNSSSKIKSNNANNKVYVRTEIQNNTNTILTTPISTKEKEISEINIEEHEINKTKDKILVSQNQKVVTKNEDKRKEQAKEKNIAIVETKKSVIETTQTGIKTETTSLAKNNKPLEISEDNSKNEAINESDNITTNDAITTDNKINTEFNPKTREYNKYGIGLHYGFEIVKINDDNIKTHNLDLSINYRNLSFIFQSGIGLQYSKDERAYNMEYRKNEYLTTQIRFDSVQFVLDSSGTPSLIPVNPYYTDVFDSVNYLHKDNFTVSYYSLRIPIMLGYQKDFGKFGAFLKGGFIYSILITSNQSDIFSLDESSRLVMLQYSGSKRVDSQIQYVMSTGLVYRINKKLHIHTEIMGKYYQNSIYDNSIYKGTKPWSIETRIGLVYFIK